ncbi:flagellar protein FliS [Tissierella praeacuta DSM 18095]|uniref:Flagellar secretion chaperone FliS n=1 Tax=Tissierella praeacuta DSM 18095 TaxID=1123404 RepID=A0A1M4X5Q6_9FIRM|nr:MULTISPECIES: flagellar export chaperone FliS [Tissierella]SHE88756.1 flagellar protein FliS [Tissierella praeacuta DSM 18095]SUO99744.1 Flagellar protein fliS [Tissierella praeacuta]
MTYEALNKYKQNSVSTATPEELTLMLYDGAIKFMNIGKYSIENKDLEKAHSSLIRAQDIILELNYSLDMNYDISKELRELYSFILSKLVDANINKDTKAIDEALVIVNDMRDTWKEVMKQIKQKVYQAK